jgi:hypothetical protein
MEAVSTSETSITFNQTTWCNIPEDSRLHELSALFVLQNLDD